VKLRIKGNFVRLRLSESEVGKIRDQGLVREMTLFGPEIENTFLYSIEAADDANSLEAYFVENQIKVLAPTTLIQSWANSDQVSIESFQSLGNNESLHILVEKDFDNERPHLEEDESDVRSDSSLC